MGEAGTVWVDVRGDTTGFMKDVQKGAQDAGKGLAGLTGNAAKTVLGDVATAGVAAGAALTGVGAIAVKTSMDFNAAMSGVSAVAGATAAEMNTLREAALKAGADTSFSATQAAEAQAELVKAGVSVSDVLGGALSGSLGLAAAGQLDLAQAAEISAQAMNIFGLAGDDVTHIADVLAAGANKSAADVKQLGDALRQGGLVASQLGIGLEDTIGALSLFADNALIGSDAGTSFKTMLQRFNPASKEAAGEMTKLGLSFYDAEGNFVGLEEAAQRLQDAMSGLTQEQRNASMNQIFGADAIRAANLLYEAGAEGVREYTNAVNDQGAAQRMAAEQLNNLKGDLEELSGATETALIRLGDLGDVSFRSVTQSATGFVDVFNDFATTPAWGAVQANVDMLGSGLGDRLDALADGLRGVLTGWTPEAINKTFGAVTSELGEIYDAAKPMIPVLAGVGAALGSMGAASVLGPLGGIVPTISPITGVLGGLILGSEDGRDALVQLGKAGGQFVSGPGKQLISSFSTLTSELSRGAVSVLEDVGGALLEVGEIAASVLGDAIEDLASPLGDLMVEGGELVASVLPEMANLLGVVLPPAVDVLGVGLDVAADAVGLLADNTWLLVPALAAFGAFKYGDQISKIGTAFSSAIGNIRGFGDAVGQVAATKGVSNLEAFGGVVRASGADVKGLAGNLVGALNPAMIGLTGAVTIGTIAYQRYAENKARVADVTNQLVDALDEERSKFNELSTETARSLFSDKDALDAVNELGSSMADLTELTALYGEDVRQLDGLFADTFSANGSIGIFRQMVSEMPEDVRNLANGIADLVEAGNIDSGQALRFFQALDELAQGSAGSLEKARTEFESIAREAASAGTITAEELDRVLSVIAEAKTPEELNAAYGILADLLGETGAAAGDAADEMQRLIDKVNELAGAERDADEANRRYQESLATLAQAFADGGAGIDATTEAGRRNADAVQRAVEQAEALAEAQARVDTTGKTSTDTLNGMAAQLAGLRDQGLLTAEEYEHLITLYGLTPEQIETRVIANTTEAQAALDDLQTEFNAKKADIEAPMQAQIQALIDAGKFAEAEALLTRLARDRQVNFKPVFESGAFKGLPTFGIDGARAAGGPVRRGGAYLVGENGPELIVPEGDGTVLPADVTADMLRGSSSVVVGADTTPAIDAMSAVYSSISATHAAMPVGAAIDDLIADFAAYGIQYHDGKWMFRGEVIATGKYEDSAPQGVGGSIPVGSADYGSATGRDWVGAARAAGYVVDYDNGNWLVNGKVIGYAQYEDMPFFANTDDPVLAEILRRNAPRARATGGAVTPGDWLVGEYGPEILRLGAAGRVFNAADTRQMQDPKMQSGSQFTSADMDRLVAAIGRLESVAGTRVDVTSNSVEGRRIGLDIADELWLRGR